VYPLVAPVEWDAFDTELFLLAGDSEPRARGSRRRLISRMKVGDQLLASPYIDGNAQVTCVLLKPEPAEKMPDQSVGGGAEMGGCKVRSGADR
jgi:hypothetical protein